MDFKIIQIVQNVWFEMTVIPFLFVILIFLAMRFGVKAEINRKFVELVFSTFVSAVLEVLSNFIPSSFWIPRLFFASIVINSWCLMRYIAAYVHFDASGFKTVNDVVLFIGSLSPFMFNSSEALYSMLSLGAASIFAFQGFGLQVVHQRYYEKGQFLVMNLLFIMLLDAFLIQFLFNVNLQFIYMVSTAFLISTLFASQGTLKVYFLSCIFFGVFKSRPSLYVNKIPPVFRMISESLHE